MFLFYLPALDVRVLALAALLAVGTVGDDLVLPVLVARREVLVALAPGVLGDARRLEVTAFTPLVRDAARLWLLDKRFQALVRRRIEAIVELEPVKGVLKRPDLRLGSADPRLLLAPQDLGQHQACKQPEDDHHHHDLDER